MQKIGVIYNPLSERTERESQALATWIKEQAMDVWVGTSQSGRDQPDEVAQCDLLVALGGDGTVLRTARLAIPEGIPILGVAMGHLSFMAEVTLAELRSSLLLLRAGGGWYDDRTLVEAHLYRDDHELVHEIALNEMLVSRTEMARIVDVDVQIDSMPLTTYHADGVIMATATGSTAYALAAGGPLLDPRSDALLLVPIAAHLTNIPALVLPPDAVVSWRLRSYYPAAFNVDGQHSYPLEPDDTVLLRRAQACCRFARVHPRSHFYETLPHRLRRD